MTELSTRPNLRGMLLLLVACTVLIACGKSVAPENASFTTQALIDPNTASEASLKSVPGVNAELAAAIIASRPYASQTALHKVLGTAVTESNQFDLYSNLFVKMGLNSAAAEDIKLIPSTLSPGHLAHEFEEYRPYTSVEQFIKEMSKYVSAEEAAFLARYVILD